MKNRNAWIQGMLSVLSLFVLFLITFYVPVLAILTIWLIPLPLMYLVSKFGWPFGTAALVIVTIALFLFLQTLYLFIPLFFIMLGLAMGQMLYLKKSAFAVLLAGSLTAVSLLILYLAISILLLHFNPVEAMKISIGQSLKTSMDQIGPLFGQDKKLLTDFYRQQLNYFGYLAPSLIVIMGVFYSIIVEVISLPILRRIGVDTPKWLPFRLWQVPKSVIWLYLFVLLFRLMGAGESGSPFFTVVINVELILQILLAIQGFSFVFYFAKVKRWPLVVPILVMAVVLVFSFPLLQLIWILGIIDLGFNLRAHLKTKI